MSINNERYLRERIQNFEEFVAPFVAAASAAGALPPEYQRAVDALPRAREGQVSFDEVLDLVDALFSAGVAMRFRWEPAAQFGRRIRKEAKQGVALDDEYAADGDPRRTSHEFLNFTSWEVCQAIASGNPEGAAMALHLVESEMEIREIFEGEKKKGEWGGRW